MTDDQIRAWLEDADRIPWLGKEHIKDCLTELLQHRELHRSIKYAVWVRDQSLKSGWTCRGWFPDRTSAQIFKERLMSYILWPDPGEFLVLPFQERPCLTAR